MKPIYKFMISMLILIPLLGTAHSILRENARKKLYPEKHPHCYIPPRNIIRDLFFVNFRSCSKATSREASRLKSLGTTVAMYYSDGHSSFYPSDPRLFDFSDSTLQIARARVNYPNLPDNWQCPDNWQDFNNSAVAYAFLRSPQEQYTGSDKIPMFIIKPTAQVNPYCRQVVFEDGHVECLTEEEAIKLWQKAGINDGY